MNYSRMSFIRFLRMVIHHVNYSGEPNGFNGLKEPVASVWLLFGPGPPPSVLFGPRSVKALSSAGRSQDLYEHFDKDSFKDSFRGEFPTLVTRGLGKRNAFLMLAGAILRAMPRKEWKCIDFMWLSATGFCKILFPSYGMRC